ncbi:MAG TPA: ATP-binding protein [Candidatus Methylomirabilis sp.]|nr:ATP-binding protein [Candidatus Methylomirabilis sp.]
MATTETTWASLWGLNRARLITALVVFGVGVLLRYVEGFSFPFLGFAAALLGMGLACLILPLSQTGIQDPRRFAWFQLSLDLVLITAVVATSGGLQSIFVPLYVLAVVAACFVLSRAGALIVAGVSSLLQIGLVVGRSAAVLLGVAEPVDMTALEILAVVLNAAVLLVVSVVIASLAARYRQSQEHLAAHRKNLSDLRAFRDLIFESVGSGLVAVDTTSRVTAFNRAAESITGVRAEEALGQPWSAIFGHGIDLDQVSLAIGGPGDLPARHEFKLRRRDDSQVPVGITFWALRSGGGEAVGLIGVCQDLSLIKQMEERMRQADRLAAVGRLAANMAHEIRNPLASISGAVQMLVKDLPTDGARGRLVEIVQKESSRLNDLVGDFLEYARPAPMARVAVDMAELIDEVLLLIEHRSLPPDLKIIREYGDSLFAQVDPQQMRQAIWNLCLNAVQAMPEGAGEIRIGSSVIRGEPRRLEIWVADTGPGIGDDDLPHIFEPFYSTKAEGSGLGLALVYRVMQDHGGQIDVRTRPGEGATFTLSLPAVPGPAGSGLNPPIMREP